MKARSDCEGRVRCGLWPWTCVLSVSTSATEHKLPPCTTQPLDNRYLGTAMIDWVSIVRHSRRRFSNYVYAVPNKVRKRRRYKARPPGGDPQDRTDPLSCACCWAHKVSECPVTDKRAVTWDASSSPAGSGGIECISSRFVNTFRE